MQNYLFTSKRLGFRNWKLSDIDDLFEINSNIEVMKYFPSTVTKEDCEKFIHRMQQQYIKNKFCYFAVEVIDTKQFIGFIGISEQTYEADFNPSIDIGWRLSPKFWGKGYAYEACTNLIEYFFSNTSHNIIYASHMKDNIKSKKILINLGFKFLSNGKKFSISRNEIVDDLDYQLIKS